MLRPAPVWPSKSLAVVELASSSTRRGPRRRRSARARVLAIALMAACRRRRASRALARLPGRQVRVPAGGQLALAFAARHSSARSGRPSRRPRSGAPSRPRPSCPARPPCGSAPAPRSGTWKGSVHSQPSAFLVSATSSAPERAAVRLAGAGLVRRAVADRRAHGDDQGRPLRLRRRRPDRRVDAVEVVLPSSTCRTCQPYAS